MQQNVNYYNFSVEILLNIILIKDCSISNKQFLDFALLPEHNVILSF